MKYFVSECDKRTEEAKIKLKETQEELTDEAVQKVNIYIYIMLTILHILYQKHSCSLIIKLFVMTS